MQVRETGVRWVVSMSVALALASPLVASEKRPVPAFALTMLDGTTVDGAATLATGTTLVVYVAPGSGPSDRLVRALKDWDSDALRTRTLVIVGTDADAARQWVSGAGDALLPARYAVDSRGDVRRALKLTGAPHLLGIADGRIEWAISGVLNDPRMLESVIRTWVTRP